jgi:Uma2 family endonuclease
MAVTLKHGQEGRVNRRLGGLGSLVPQRSGAIQASVCPMCYRPPAQPSKVPSRSVFRRAECGLSHPFLLWMMAVLTSGNGNGKEDTRTGASVFYCAVVTSLNFHPDDGIVVEGHMTTDEYLYGTDETSRKRELAYGIMREPPAPFFSHQQLVLRVATVLASHVDARNLGQVAIAPLDVILDRDRNLIVQPDVLFVSRERLSIIDKQVWGAPDLVVEVLSGGTEEHDRGEKLGWYRQYGVRESWLVDLRNQEVAVFDFIGPEPVRRTARGPRSIQSSVLPAFQVTAFDLFA